jgi:RNA polymerase sigma-70 factor (sigma-E family)
VTSTQRERDDAFAAFVVAYRRRLLHLAELLAADPMLAEDLAQTALARTYTAWNRITGDPWPYTQQVLLNAQRDWWRRRRWRERPLSEVPEPVAAGPDVAAELANRAVVLAAMRRLSASERAVVALRYYLDLSENETAGQLGIPAGTAKSTLARALRKLRGDPTLSLGSTVEEVQ